MYEVRKKFQISAAHQLSLNYESKCSNIHGHNWNICVICCAETLDENGMVYDFSLIKKKVSELLDHKCLNGLIVIDGKAVNPTAENIAHWIALTIGDCCTEVCVEESEGNMAIWRKS